MDNFIFVLVTALLFIDTNEVTVEILREINLDKHQIKDFYTIPFSIGTIPEENTINYTIQNFTIQVDTTSSITWIPSNKTNNNHNISKYNSSLSYMNNGSGFKDENGVVHKGLDLINEGYINMMDIPESWIKNENHFIQRNCLVSNEPYINKEKIKLALNNIKYPIYHLDFETFPCPLPRFKGEKCYTQSPFQFSLHIERTPGVCDKEKDHFEFLSRDPSKDERRELAEKLCEYIEPDGTLFAQNVPFEMGRIKELAEIFPEFRDKLLAIRETGSDLLYIVKGNSSFYESMNYHLKHLQFQQLIL